MQYKSIHCDSLIKNITNIDTLFHGDYSVDPYQNCTFGCLYCDSSFDETIYIKSNAHRILDQEIQKIKKGVVIVGSVHDPYQKVEENYGITREILKTIEKYGFPCHILTKSNLILRDIDILSRIKECIVTISITSLNESISNIFEKKVLNPKDRLNIIKSLSQRGIKTGLALIPVLPYIVDDELENIIKTAKKSKASYVLHKYLELKGDQKTVFYQSIKQNYPYLFRKYRKLYADNYMPDEKYTEELNKKIQSYCKKHKIPNKI
jgi:DNA repair photolyase